jgi:acyl carrier protein
MIIASHATDAPRTATEQLVLRIWSEVLNTDAIGVHDDFLELGGDSLAAMRCINAIRAALGVDLTLDAFILPPAHIAEVASQIDKARHLRGDALATRGA